MHNQALRRMEEKPFPVCRPPEVISVIFKTREDTVLIHLITETSVPKVLINVYKGSSNRLKQHRKNADAIDKMFDKHSRKLGLLSAVSPRVILRSVPVHKIVPARSYPNFNG